MHYQPVKLSVGEENVFFWSDTHFNHKCERWPVPLWKLRGFSSVEEHNSQLIERWKQTCNSSSIVFHLGDFIFGYDSIQHFKSIISEVPFKELYIMPGNHNSGWKQVFEEQKSNIWYLSNKRVIFIPNYLEAMIGRQLVVMSHYPILSFNGQSKGSICVYGHVHGNLEKNEIGKLYSQAKTIEVTVEQCPSPISLKQIKLQLENKQPIVFDSHLNC